MEKENGSYNGVRNRNDHKMRLTGNVTEFMAEKVKLSKQDNLMMDKAVRTSRETYCKRLSVGAVFSKHGRSLIDGYNGAISGMPNECEEPTGNMLEGSQTVKVNFYSNGEKIISTATSWCEKNGFTFVDVVPTTAPGNSMVFELTIDYTFPEMRTSEFTVHAEQNVIYYAAKTGISLDRGTMYITHAPCKECSKAMASAGIKRVVFGEHYRDTDGIDFLLKCGVQVVQHSK